MSRILQAFSTVGTEWHTLDGQSMTRWTLHLDLIGAEWTESLIDVDSIVTVWAMFIADYSLEHIFTGKETFLDAINQPTKKCYQNQRDKKLEKVEEG